VVGVRPSSGGSVRWCGRRTCISGAWRPARRQFPVLLVQPKKHGSRLTKVSNKFEAGIAKQQLWRKGGPGLVGGATRLPISKPIPPEIFPVNINHSCDLLIQLDRDCLLSASTEVFGVRLLIPQRSSPAKYSIFYKARYLFSLRLH